MSSNLPIADPADDPLRILDHPIVATSLSLRAFGDATPRLTALGAEIRARVGSAGRVLVVGADRGAVAAILAAAPGCNLLAITGHTQCEQLALAPASLDAVVALGVHRLVDLERFWRTCHTALGQSGVLLAQEYVGPADFAWRPEQRRHAQEAFATWIAPAFPGAQLSPRTRVGRAPRADQLMATCKSAGFRTVGSALCGCSLVLPALADCDAVFDASNWTHNLVLAELFRAEADLIDAGELGHDYAMFVAITE